eukprot:gene10919-12079_t
MAEKREKKSKRDTALSNVCILIDDTSENAFETRPLKEIATGIQPISYEEELIQRKNEIQRDKHSAMLLFPDDDITVYKIPRQLRTTCSSVPQQAYREMHSLFVKECIKSYTLDWFVIENQYEAYSRSYHHLPCHEDITKQLLNQVFEVDIEESEVDGVQDASLVLQKEKGIFKEGYLTKSPFHPDTSPAYASKTYKRRWFTLKQVSNDGSYLLEYKKDEASTMAKGTLYLDSCTHITKSLKGRMHGFELHIQDKVYGLAADSSSEMNSWIKALCKATGIDIEQEKTLRSFFGGRKVQAKHSNFKESLKQSNHPLLLEYANESDHSNAKRRQEKRIKLFASYSELGNKYDVRDESEEEVRPFEDAACTDVLVSCQNVQFKLAVLKEDDSTMQCEPFFTTWCLFDVREGRKLTEDFVCDLNETGIKAMVMLDGVLVDGNKNGTGDGTEDIRPKQAVFSVHAPHPDIYLVVRITKILQQGGITQCAEPYMRSTDSSKSAQKVQRHAATSWKRLRKYMMPFAWAMRSLFKNKDGEIDSQAEFSAIFKQETAKLSDDEFVKLIQDVKADKVKQQVIPGQVKCFVTKQNPNQPNCYTTSLVPVKPHSQSKDVPCSLEIQQFVAETPEFAAPFTSYLNHFYIYPISLNYNNQKAFSKARNIACKIQFKDSDELNSPPLKSIYSQDGSCSLTTNLITPVLHHNTSPTFYKEAKVLLPTHLHNKHHILFTFYHVSVEQPKHDSQKLKNEVETAVGYAWMPVLESGIVRANKSDLAVASSLPERYMSSDLSEVKWADGKGLPLFKVNTRLVSTVYTQDHHINHFFAHWQLYFHKPGSEVETSRLLKLMHAVDVTTVLRFLPVILNQLFDVLLTVRNDDVSVNVIRTLIRIIAQTHEAGKEGFLKTYVKYVFRTTDENNLKTVHGEMAKHLSFYLKPGSDPAIIDCILQRAWFFFDIIVKSMAQCHLSNSRKSKKKYHNLFDIRDARYPHEYHSSLESLLQVFVVQLAKKRNDKFQVSKDANYCLAGFIKKCFTHMDRGFVFQMVNYVKDQFKSPDPQMFELKFDFLRSISEHEHYVALNMPLDIRAVGGVHESRLNDVFCRKHFLVGLILKEVSSALYEGKAVRSYAIKLIRNLLVKHEFDDRYQAEERQARIAALYIPFLPTILEHAPRFHKSLDRPFIDDSLLSMRQHVISPNSGRNSPAPARHSAISLSVGGALTNNSIEQNQKVSYVPFDEDERKELLLCFIFILKKLSPGTIVDWWREILNTSLKRPHWTPTALYYVHDKNFAKFMAVIDFFDLLECCLNNFGYQGRKVIEKSPSTESTKLYFEQKYRTVTSVQQIINSGHKKSASDSRIDVTAAKAYARMSSAESCSKTVLMNANFSNEVTMVVLDMFELFCTHFKFHLEQDSGDNILMKKIFNVLMGFLRIHQSEYVLKHVFASLRSFIHKFPASLFKGSANLCGVLCYEILRMCNSKIEAVRKQACCFMYLLMRNNYEFSGTGCVRVHLQVIVAVSKLLASGMNRFAMNSSLSIIKNYAVDDKGMKSTEFPAEVRDLIKKVHTVLQATAKMKEHENDVEVLVDLEYSLAKSYSSTPELRQTWLQSMAEIHEKNSDFSEAAMCYIHAAALVAEYLRRKGLYADGCGAFRAISPNLIPDECAMKNDDEGTSEELRYTKEDLINLLENGIERLKRAERYEVMGTVYKIAIPLYEEDRDFPRLALAYQSLHAAYDNIVGVMASGKRLLGRFYRIAFYGRSFKDDDGKEYIYKEPKLTSLPEISERLQTKYNDKLGNVKIIQDSANVKQEELNPAVNYIQVTFVRPYFDDEEMQKRPTGFERENNIRRFVYETPFTLSGKAHGSVCEQHKRKTILTTSHCFPYVKKRILVVQQEMYELSPLEVAIEEMQTRLNELDHVINLSPPDMKKLQLKLQGSVSVQVNAGPLAYARTFLSDTAYKEYPSKHIETLKTVYREFVLLCGKALEVNAHLIKPDQEMYQEDLKSKYEDLQEKLAPFVGAMNGSLGSLTLPGLRRSFAGDSDV